MSSWLASTNDRIRALLTLLLLGLLLLILMATWAALLPFFLGLIVAYILLPAVNFLDRHAPALVQRRGWSRPVAIIVVYIVVLAVIAGLLSYFIPVVSGQFAQFVEVVPEYLQRAQGLFTIDLDQLLEGIPPAIRTAIENGIDNALSAAGSAIQAGVVATVTTLFQTISFLLGLIIIPFWLFYVLNDSTRARQGFLNLIPERARGDVQALISLIDDLLSAYVRGQLLLMLLIGALSAIALAILGVDLALLLGTFAGLFEVIPVLGPFLGAIPAVLIALIERPSLALWVALAFVIIQQVENIFLAPRISGGAVRLHPALVMVVVVVGSQLAGLLGVLLAVPTTAVLRDVFQYAFLRTTERGATPELALETMRANIP